MRLLLDGTKKSKNLFNKKEQFWLMHNSTPADAEVGVDVILDNSAFEVYISNEITFKSDDEYINTYIDKIKEIKPKYFATMDVPGDVEASQKLNDKFKEQLGELYNPSNMMYIIVGNEIDHMTQQFEDALANKFAIIAIPFYLGKHSRIELIKALMHRVSFWENLDRIHLLAFGTQSEFNFLQISCIWEKMRSIDSAKPLYAARLHVTNIDEVPQTYRKIWNPLENELDLEHIEGVHKFAKRYKLALA